MAHGPLNFKPLAQLRVLDLTRVLAGPYGTMLLADLGAEVIKVEHPLHWDETRRWGPPFVPGREDATYFFAANRNKRSIGLDFSQPQGLDLLSRLIGCSHVLVDNFVPGKLEKLGVTDAFVKNANPKLVWGSISGFGTEGPKAQSPGYAVIMEAFAGMMSVTGPKEGPPVKLGVAWTDIITGLHLDIAVLAALLNTPRTFVHIDTSLLNSQVSALANIATAFLVAGVQGERLGADHASIVPYGTFECADGFIAVAVGNEDMFAAFAQVVRPEMTADAQFATNGARVRNRVAFHEKVDPIFKGESKKYWCDRLEKAGVPVSPVNGIAEVFSHPQVQAVHGVIRSTDDKFSFPGYPFSFRGFPADAPCETPPLRGQHTDEVLKGLLNLTDVDIRALRAANIVG